MRIKKISAKNLSEGKILVRQELGDEAVILSTRNVKDKVTGIDSLEIVAAIDEKITPIPNQEKNLPNKVSQSNHDIDEFLEAFRYPLLEYLSPKLQKSYIFLRKLGFKDKFIGSLIQELTISNKFEFTNEEILNLIVAKIKTENLFVKRISRKIYGFTGHSGVGKTSSLLKFASVHQLMHDSKILVVCADTYNYGASDLLAAYCKVLNLNFKKISTNEELDKLIDESKNYDLVLIDFDSKSNYMNSSVENILLLPTYATRNFIEKQLNKYSSSYIAFTGVDDHIEIQSIIDIIITKNLKLTFFTDGGNIPDDINQVDSSGLKKLILGNG